MGIGIWELLLLFLIIVVLFGTRKLRDIGGDLGAAVRSFRGAIQEDTEEKATPRDDGEAATKPKSDAG